MENGKPRVCPSEFQWTYTGFPESGATNKPLDISLLSESAINKRHGTKGRPSALQEVQHPPRGDSDLRALLPCGDFCGHEVVVHVAVVRIVEIVVESVFGFSPMRIFTIRSGFVLFRET